MKHNSPRTIFLLLFLVMTAITVLAITVGVSIKYYPTEAQDNAPEYELICFDDFLGKELDTLTWSKIKRIHQAPWIKYMSPHQSLYNVKNGRLRLYARKNNKRLAPQDTASYITGGITSEGKVSIKYGKVEVKAKIYGARGAWPAIWMGSEEHRPYPDYAEIDIMEHLNYDDYVYQTTHTNHTDKLKLIKQSDYSVKAPIKAKDYNIYSVEILPTAIIYSLNGKETLRYKNRLSDQPGQYPFGTNMYLMIDMQVGGKWVGEPNEKDYPAYIDIDWVKIYQLKQ